ncbi:MAG: hypothetical protein FJ109_04905 [Deltaproteobacteria bacterium]|nr:hypothetical protein [Deltaproteobacteria bacterium]
MVNVRFRTVAIALWCCLALSWSCSGDGGGLYVPGDLSVPDAVETDSVAVDIPEEMPDLSGVSLEEEEGLLVRIVGPHSDSSFTWSAGALEGSSPFVPLGVVVHGEYDSLYAMTDANDQVVPADPPAEGESAAWRSRQMKVTLKPPVLVGDGLFEAQATRVWIVAQKGEVKAWDSVVVVANPGFVMGKRPLKLLPDVVFAGDTSGVLFRFDLNNVENFDASQVFLMEADAECSKKVEGTARLMKDDGLIDESGDEIGADRVYSVRLHQAFEQPGIRLYRAAVTGAVAGKKLVAYSPCIALRVVKRADPLDCTVARSVLLDLRGEMDARLDAGWERTDVRKWGVLHLLEQKSVAEAGASEGEDLVWARFHTGMLGIATPSRYAGPASTVLFPDPAGSEPATTVLPRSRRVAAAFPEKDGAADAGKWPERLEGGKCPPFRQLGSKLRLSALRMIAEAGVVVMAGQGGRAFGGLSDEARKAYDSATLEFDAPIPAWTGWEHAGAQDVVELADPFQCDLLSTTYDSCIVKKDGTCVRSDNSPCPSYLECVLTHGGGAGVAKGVLFDRVQADLMSGRLALTVNGLAVTPSFLKHYAGGDVGPQVAMLGFSHSVTAGGGTMAAELLAAGANSVVGSLAEVSADDAVSATYELLGRLVEEKQAPAWLIPRVEAAFGDHDWRLAGAGNVAIHFPGLLNADFASGTLDGWEHTGDARVLESLCGIKPSGQFMGLLSSGLGFTVQTGRISQEFCLEVGKLVFEGWYDFISHEFEGGCGSAYSDTFRMYVEDDKGQKIHLARTEVADFIGVNALCPCDAGACPSCGQCGSAFCVCGELYHPDDGELLIPWPEECAFDPGDEDGAFESGWRHTGEIALTQLGQGGLNKPVRFVIEVSDQGSAGSTTTVLVDSLTFK